MKIGFQLLLMLKIVLFMKAWHVSCRRDEWPTALFRILYARNEMVSRGRQMKIDHENENEPDPNAHKRFLADIQQVDFVNAMEDFALASFDVPVRKRLGRQISISLSEDRGDVKASWSFSGKNLESFTDSSRSFFDALIQRMDDDSDDYVTTEGLCSSLPKPYPKLDISITDICSSINHCAKESYPYGESNEYFHEGFHDAKESCTDEEKCNIKKAWPMMAGVLFYSINSFLLQRFCPNEYSLTNEDLNNMMVKLQRESQLALAYGYIMPPLYQAFYTEFLQNWAVRTDLTTTLQLIEEKEAEFRVMPVACEEIKLSDACVYGDIFTQYIFLNKFKAQRSDPGSVKDLRLNSKVEKQTMIKLKKESLQHLETLHAIEKLDENLRASVEGISSYFGNLASYDEGIAEQDITFIQNQLTKFENDLNDVQKRLNTRMSSLGDLQLSVAVLNLAEASAHLAARIVENCNPLRVIFGGSEPGDIAEAMAKVGNALANSVKATALKVAAGDLNSDSEKFNTAFFNGDKSNKNQIASLKSLVDKVREGKSEDIGADGAKFINEYGAYTPKADRSKLAKNNALWATFKDSMCDMVNEDVGVLGSPVKLASGMLLICEDLDGILAQFFTLREDIFTFQFQMVDALARIVRGNMAKRLSANIKGKGDVLDAGQLVVGFLMTHSRLQSHAALFCDILEYKNLGIPVDVCSAVLFNKDDLDLLIAYKDTSPPSLVERDVFIPTKPDFQGDSGYIDLGSHRQPRLSY